MGAKSTFLFLFFFSLSPVHSFNDPQEKLDAKVLEWIDDLHSPSFEDRENAITKLMENWTLQLDAYIRAMPKSHDLEFNTGVQKILKSGPSFKYVLQLHQKLDKNLKAQKETIFRYIASDNEEKLIDLVGATCQILTLESKSNIKREALPAVLGATLARLRYIHSDITQLDDRSNFVINRTIKSFLLDSDYKSIQPEILQVVRQFIPWLKGSLKDTVPTKRSRMLSSLALILTRDEAIELIVPFLNDESSMVRFKAIDELKRLNATEASSEIFKYCNDPDGGVRRSCVEYFLAMGPEDKNSLPAITKLFSDHERYVGLTAMKGLYRWGQLERTLLNLPQKGALGITQHFGKLHFYEKEGLELQKSVLNTMLKHSSPAVQKEARRIINSRN